MDDAVTMHLLISWVVTAPGPRGKTVAAPLWMRASAVEKLGAAGLG